MNVECVDRRSLFSVVFRKSDGEGWDKLISLYESLPPTSGNALIMIFVMFFFFDMPNA